MTVEGDGEGRGGCHRGAEGTCAVVALGVFARGCSCLYLSHATIILGRIHAELGCSLHRHHVNVQHRLSTAVATHL